MIPPFSPVAVVFLAVAVAFGLLLLPLAVASSWSALLLCCVLLLFLLCLLVAVFAPV